MILRTAECLHAFAVCGSSRIDILRDRRAADEAHGRDARVRQNRIDRDLIAMHDVEDALGESGLIP